MSYAHWLGQTWPHSTDDASLYVHIPSRNCPAALIDWDLELDHFVESSQPGPDGKKKLIAALHINITNLGLRPRTWLDLSGQHIHADAHWYEQTTASGPYGHAEKERFRVSTWFEDDCPETATLGPTEPQRWVAIDFEIRFGRREGYVFPCEIDAWVIPEADFAREEPETPEELATFGQGPPNLRLITRAIFRSGTIDMPRSGDDPWPQAQREIHAALGPFDIKRHNIRWNVCRRPPPNDLQECPGGRSRVQFWVAKT